MSDPRPTLLLVDDENSLNTMRGALESDFECLLASTTDEALSLMQDNFVQAVFCDQSMPDRGGVELLNEVGERWPETVRIMLTDYTEPDDMITAINDAGIYQLLTKPCHPDHLVMTAKNASDLFRLNRDHERMSLEMRYLSRGAEAKLEDQRKALREGLGFENVLRTPNSPINAVIAQARQFASFDVPVLIVGESGTGKSAIARAIHNGSLRSDRPFYEINCVGVDDTILEIELFGARRGTLPGVPTNKRGLLHKADRGTLFINGVDELSPRIQLALLRAATEGRFLPLGGHEEQQTDVRLITGSSQNLRAKVAENGYRSDLYYAMARATLEVPPLRERKGDIEILAQDMLFNASAAHSKPVHGLSDDAIRFLEGYDWPGNLRELENEIVRMLIFSQDRVLGPELISRHILQAVPGPEPADHAVDSVLSANGTLKDRVEEIEMRILRETLTRLKWNKSRAADELGLSRVGLRAKVERYGIAEPCKSNQQEEA
ncbi:MAG: sigma-54 dependent transcriptional regulator [Pseudomonadota bacterium]